MADELALRRQCLADFRALVAQYPTLGTTHWAPLRRMRALPTTFVNKQYQKETICPQKIIER